ncbi:hypothetical protein DBR43_30260, partial [Pedobacter sp. KBW06]|uniref:condensation domain-containing protein n=1 Tax=Pedobacter sp. KBW06 TaxID=2153359 RepID=UPI000F90257C
LSSPVFDAATLEIWTPLLKGALLAIHQDVRTLVSNPQYFARFLAENQVSVLWLTKTLFDGLFLLDQTLFARLRYLIIGGEALDKTVVNRMLASPHKPAIFLNGYGPTESTTFTCTYVLEHQVTGSTVPIGKPITNRKVYVLDSSQQPVPVGVPGELHIAGAGLARGYLNDPELTAERFIRSPFASETEKQTGADRMYKTGDLVRWLPDGNIAFIGRNDEQVKIRGYRIELPEIEHAIVQIPGVAQASVLVRERQTSSGLSKFLTGYYVLDPGHTPKNDAGILDGWEDLYDIEYGKHPEAANTETDFSGWNSYITAEPIPLQEMQAWRKDILEIIHSLEPKNVLEIGVGSGLLMYPLLDTVQQYTGLDISKTVINRHIRYLEGKNTNLQLFHLKADQVDQVPAEQPFDTVIVNSVSQYFPGIAYFEDMLLKAFDKLGENGVIFLGDIRNYDLQKQLITEKLQYAGKTYQQQDIDRIALRDNEFLLSPTYFTRLPERYADMEVSLLLRNGSYDNELSRYRYDVLITRRTTNKTTINKSQAPPQGTYNLPFLNQLTNEDILSAVRKVLPDYMVPTALVQMDSFPLTTNGKLDRRALPDPETGDGDKYVAPQNETQTGICNIWQEVLGISNVGIDDDFFQVGGNSILAIQTISRIKKEFSVLLSPKDLFQNTTVRQIAALLLTSAVQEQAISEEESPNSQHHAAIDSDHIVADVLKSQAWRYLDYKAGIRVPKNAVLYISYHQLDKKALNSAMDSLVMRHDNLRARFFDCEDGKVRQQIKVSNIMPTDIQVQDLSDLADVDAGIRDNIMEMSKSVFDFRNEPAFKYRLLQLNENKHLLVFVIDHIIYDAHSLKLIKEELSILYDAYAAQQPNPLIPLKLQFKDYVKDHNSHYTGEKLQYHQAYYDNIFSHPPAKPTLKREQNESGSAPETAGAAYTFFIEKELLDEIVLLTTQLKLSFFNYMLATYSVLLSEISDQNDFLIDSPMSTRLGEDYAKIVGWLTGALVTRIKTREDSDFKALLFKCREAVVDAMDHIYYQSLHLHLPKQWNELATQLNVINDIHTADGYIEDFSDFHSGLDYIYFDIAFAVRVYQNGISVEIIYKPEVLDKNDLPLIAQKFTAILKENINSVAI